MGVGVGVFVGVGVLVGVGAAVTEVSTEASVCAGICKKEHAPNTTDLYSRLSAVTSLGNLKIRSQNQGPYEQSGFRQHLIRPMTLNLLLYRKMIGIKS